VQEKIESVTRIIRGDENSLNPGSWKSITALAEENNCFDIAKKIAILSYVKSMNFNTADIFFERFIEPNLNSFTADELIELLEGIDSNEQTYNRKAAAYDHMKLRHSCNKVLSEDFDFSKYDRWLPELEYEI
jgi:hypothetical protein